MKNGIFVLGVCFVLGAAERGVRADDLSPQAQELITKLQDDQIKRVPTSKTDIFGELADQVLDGPKNNRAEKNDEDFEFSKVSDSAKPSESIQITAEHWTLTHIHKFGLIKSLLRSQGVATDDKGHFWYSSRSSLLRTNSLFGMADWLHLFPLPHALKKMGDNHIGDIDYANGKLYIPIEDGPKYKNPYIGLVDPKSLKIEKYFRLPQEQQRDGVPWVCVDASSHRVYSAEYSNVTKINIYDMETLAPVGQIQMDQKLQAIQGAKIFEGNMYMTTDGATGKQHVIHKLNLQTGVVTKVGDLPDNLNEVEGLVFVKSPTGTAVHVLGVVPVWWKIRRTAIFTFTRDHAGTPDQLMAQEQ